MTDPAFLTSPLLRITRADGIEKEIRVQDGHLFVCQGCCCGRTDKGFPPLPLDDFKQQWKARGIRRRFHLTITGCLGPCPLANVVLLVFGGRALWLHSINAPADVSLLYDYVERMLRASAYQDPPPELAWRVFQRYLSPVLRSQAMNSVEPLEWDSVELRAGRLRRIKRAEARLVDSEDGMLAVAKCYCRTHDVVTQAEAEMQMRPAFVFPVDDLHVLESLIGQELVGRAYFDSPGRRVKFLLDLKEQAGFRMEEGVHQLESPWFDESVLNE